LLLHRLNGFIANCRTNVLRQCRIQHLKQKENDESDVASVECFFPHVFPPVGPPSRVRIAMGSAEPVQFTLNQGMAQIRSAEPALLDRSLDQTPIFR
jgi:hypothetical protein